MLAQHPDILEVGVVAVPDSHYGERPKAFVTAKSRTLTGTDVLSWAKHSSPISGFMVSRHTAMLRIDVDRFFPL